MHVSTRSIKDLTRKKWRGMCSIHWVVLYLWLWDVDKNSQFAIKRISQSKPDLWYSLLLCVRWINLGWDKKGWMSEDGCVRVLKYSAKQSHDAACTSCLKLMSLLIICFMRCQKGEDLGWDKKGWMSEDGCVRMLKYSAKHNNVISWCSMHILLKINVIFDNLFYEVSKKGGSK